MSTKSILHSLIALLMLACSGQLFAQEFAYVSNIASDNVTVIDLGTGSVVATIPVGDVPRHIAVAPDGSSVAVTNSGDGTISIIDVATNTVSATLPSVVNSTSALYNQAGTGIYQSSLVNNQIRLLDATTGAALDSISFPGAGPSGLAQRPGTDEIYVVLSSLGELGSFDATTNTPSPNTILLEGASGGSSTNPFNVAITSDGNTAVVPNSSSTITNVVDFTTSSVSRVQELLLGIILTEASMGAPLGVAVTPDGTQALVCEESAGELSIIELTSGDNLITNTISLGAGTQPLEVAVSGDGTTAIVTLFGTNEVAIVDIAAGTFTTLGVGSDPRGVGIASPSADPCVSNPPAPTTLNVTICDGESFDFGGNSITVAGTYLDTVVTGAGCDSIITLNLTVAPAVDPIVETTVNTILGNNTVSAGGISAAVLNPDGSIVTSGQGFANIGLSVTEDVFFGTSDFANHLMAVLTLRLVEEGLVSLTDQIGGNTGNLLLDNAALASYYPANTSVAQLLTHLSGIYNIGADAGYKNVATSPLFLNFANDFSTETPSYSSILQAFTFPPSPNVAAGIGSFNYSNTNFLVLGEVLENATGQSLQSLLETYVLNPAGLDDIEFWGLGNTPPSPASTYYFNLSGFQPEALVNQTSVLTSLGAASSIVATPKAVAYYMRALFGGQILSSASTTQLTTFIPSNGRLGTGYGLGTEEFTVNIDGTDYTAIGHTGELNYGVAFIYVPTLSAGAYVSTNNDDVSEATVLDIAVQLISGALNPDPCLANPPVPTTLNVTICAGESFDFGGNSITNAGTYVDTVVTAAGCDSVVTLNLTVAPAPDSTVVTSVNNVLANNSIPAGGISAAVLNPNGSIVTAFQGFSNIGLATDETQFFGTSDFANHLMAVLTLRLVEEGLVSLTDQIGGNTGNLLLDNAALASYYPANTSLEQLLAHLSGIYNIGADAGYKDVATSPLFLNFANDFSTEVPSYSSIIQGFTFPPSPNVAAGIGSFNYSNTNFLVLGEVLENATGQSLQSLLETYVLTPAGLNDIEFWGLGNTPPSPASTYYFNLSGFQPEALVNQTSVLTSLGAASSIVATPKAVAYYMRALFGGQILNSSSTTQLTTFAPSNGRLGTGYGLGTEEFTVNIDGTDYTAIGHTGELNYGVAFIYVPDLSAGAYVSTNNDDVSEATVLDIAVQLISGALNPDPCAGVTPITATVDTSICEGESFSFGGQTFTSSTSFVDTTLSAAGCDSLITTVNLTVNDTNVVNVALTSCNPADTGVVTLVLANQFGCDSTVITTTTLLPSDETTVNLTSCNPADTGSVVANLTNQFGCDSTVTTITTLLPSDSTVVNLESCNPADTGSVVVTLTNQFGCDSVITTVTTLLPSDDVTVNLTSCNPADTGTVVVTLTNQFGCDSVVTTITTLLDTDITNLTAETCDPAQVGVDTTSFTNQFGCDSLVILTTSLLPSDTVNVLSQSCNPADTGVVTFVLTNQFGCDSTVIVNTTLLPSDETTLNLESCNPADTGTVVTTLTNQFGCDSVVTAITTLLPSDTVNVAAESCNPSETGVETVVLTNQFGCDSTVITTTTLLPTDEVTVNLESCNPADTGTVVTALTNQFGCDSFVTVITTLLPSDETTVNLSSCNPADTGSVVVTLTNQFGCDSVVTTVTSLLPSDTTFVSASTCDSTLAGVDTTFFTNQFGCDSVVITTTTASSISITNLSATTCDPLLVGVDTVSLIGQSGCDSLVITTTSLLPSDTTNVSATTCDPAAVGTSSNVFTNQFGCDSLVITTTTLLPSDTTNVSATTCDPAAVGTSSNVFTNQFGCDSLVITTTTLLPSDTTNVSATTCDPAAAGTSSNVFTNQFGCDSLVITTTTLLPSDTTNVSATTCDPAEAGSFTVVLTNQFGCDSVVITTNILLPTSFTTLDTTLGPGASIVFGGQTITTAGTFTDTLVAANGCDSIITLNVSLLGCTADAGTITADSTPVTLSGANVLISATPDGNQVVPAGYTQLYVLTSGQNLVIEQTSATPQFTVSSTGLFTIHTLIYTDDSNDPNFLDLSIVVPGTTTGGDVLGIVTQNGLCADLDVTGAPIQVEAPAFVCTADAGTITADSTPVTLSGASVLISATPDGNQVVPAGYTQLYVLTSGQNLVIEQTSATPQFTVSSTGLFTIHTLIYTDDSNDPNFLDLSIVVPGTTTGGDVLGIVTQNGLCADLDVTGAPIQVEAPAFVCTADAGTITPDATPVTLSGANVLISATPDGNQVVPAGYTQLYVLTSGPNLIIEQTSATPGFIVSTTGLFTIHTLIYTDDSNDPNFLDLSIVVPGTTTGGDVLGIVTQNGLCADLDVTGAPIQVEAPAFVCTADAGTITADSTPVTLSGANVLISATPDGNQVVPAGYTQLYVLTSGQNLVIEQTSATPQFTVSSTGLFTIHTLIYTDDSNDPNFLDLSIVVPGTTTGGDVLGIVTQNGLCADLDVTGAPIQVEAPAFVCTADAGTITADSTPVTLSGASVVISATPDGNQVVPAGYTQLYVLTSGSGLVIEQTSATPQFTVSSTGLFTIHTLIFTDDSNDPNFLDLSIVVPGTTTGGDVLGIVTQNGLCADLDVAGAPIQVEAPVVGLAAPTNLVADNSTFFLVPLTWEDNSNNEDGFRVIRDGVVVAILPANSTSYQDTVLVFGSPVTFQVEAFNASESAASNTDTYSMPAVVQPLQLSYVCYDPISDSLTWSVTNTNSQILPFIYAQWWNPQRDTLFALGSSTVEFQTLNNPQDPATFGDDNITGIWWIDQNLLAGEPNQVIFSIPLTTTCPNRPMTNPAPDAGNFFSGTLGGIIQVITTNINDEFLAQAINVSPNPFTNTLRIDTEGIQAVASIRVLNVLGQEVFGSQANLASPVVLDLSDLAVGVYTLEINVDNVRFTQKVVKD